MNRNSLIIRLFSTSSLIFLLSACNLGTPEKDAKVLCDCVHQNQDDWYNKCHELGLSFENKYKDNDVALKKIKAITKNCK